MLNSWRENIMTHELPKVDKLLLANNSLSTLGALVKYLDFIRKESKVYISHLPR